MRKQTSATSTYPLIHLHHLQLDLVQRPLFKRIHRNFAFDALLSIVCPAVGTHPFPFTLVALELAETSFMTLVRGENFFGFDRFWLVCESGVVLVWLILLAEGCVFVVVIVEISVLVKFWICGAFPEERVLVFNPAEVISEKRVIFLALHWISVFSVLWNSGSAASFGVEAVCVSAAECLTVWTVLDVTAG